MKMNRISKRFKKRFSETTSFSPKTSDDGEKIFAASQANIHIPVGLGGIVQHSSPAVIRKSGTFNHSKPASDPIASPSLSLNTRLLQKTIQQGLVQTISKQALVVWGSDQNLGLNYPIQDIAFRSVDCSGRHFGAVTDTGDVYTWGNGRSGQLGHGDYQEYKEPKIVDFFQNKQANIISCAYAQTAVITEDKKFFIFGWRGEGRGISTPELIQELENMPILSVALGAYHVLVLVDHPQYKKVVYSFGKSDFGQLGYAVGDGKAYYPPTIIESLKSKQIVAIRAGETSSCAINIVGEVFVWGNNQSNILAVPCTQPFVEIPLKVESLLGIPIVYFAFGTDFCAALSESGAVYTCGRNQHGQLGLGDSESRSTLIKVDALASYDILGISVGNSHVIAWTSEAEVFTWGNNISGRLGISKGESEVLKVDKPTIMNILSKKYIHQISTGTKSIAIISEPVIQINHGADGKIERHLKIEKGMKIGDIKQILLNDKPDEIKNHCIIHEENQQILSTDENLFQLFNKRIFNLKLVNKSEHKGLKDKEDLKFIYSDNDIPIISTASIEQLIQWLFNIRYSNHTFLQEFLITYRTFITPNQLLQQLIMKYQSVVESVKSVNVIYTSNGVLPVYNDGNYDDDYKIDRQLVMSRINSILTAWISDHEGDFFNSNEESRILLNDLHQFIDNIIAKFDPPSAIYLTRLFHRMDPMYRKLQFTEELAPASCGKTKNKTTINIHTYPALEIARQLCLIGFEYYSKIEAKELLNLAWTQKDNKKAAKNVIKMIHRSNSISNWVSKTILREKTQKKKVKTYEKFVDIGNHCLQLNNYNSIMEILSGLQSNSVLKDQKTWTSDFPVSSKHQKITEEWGEMLIAHNKILLRERLEKAQPPCIPFLGLYLTDLFHIEEGNKNTINGLVNFRKATLIASVIKRIQKFQKTPYQLLPVEQLQNYLNVNIEGSDSLDDLNNQIDLQSAEAQINFLNKTSTILSNRHKNEDLDGERITMWSEWGNKIENFFDLNFIFIDNSRCNFTEVFLRSHALERSIQSAIISFPEGLELQLFSKLINLTLAAEINEDFLLELLQLARNTKFPSQQRELLSELISSFKNIHGALPSLPNIDKVLNTFVMFESPSEFDNLSDEMKFVIDHKKLIKFLMIQIAKESSTIEYTISQIKATNILLKHCDLAFSANILDFLHSQIGKIQSDVDIISEKKYRAENIGPLLPLDVCKQQHQLTQLQNQLVQWETEMVIIKDNLSNQMKSMRDLLLNSKDKTVNLNESIINVNNQINAIDRLLPQFDILQRSTLEKYQFFYSKRLELTVLSVLSLNSYLDAAFETTKTTLEKLNFVKSDISRMGIRYGAMVVQSLENTYQQLKDSHTLCLPHYIFAVDTLQALQVEAKQLNSNNIDTMLDCAVSKFTSIQDIHDTILQNHY